MDKSVKLTYLWQDWGREKKAAQGTNTLKEINITVHPAGQEKDSKRLLWITPNVIT